MPSGITFLFFNCWFRCQFPIFSVTNTYEFQPHCISTGTTDWVSYYELMSTDLLHLIWHVTGGGGGAINDPLSNRISSSSLLQTSTLSDRLLSSVLEDKCSQASLVYCRRLNFSIISRPQASRHRPGRVGGQGREERGGIDGSRFPSLIAVCLIDHNAYHPQTVQNAATFCLVLVK